MSTHPSTRHNHQASKNSRPGTVTTKMCSAVHQFRNFGSAKLQNRAKQVSSQCPVIPDLSQAEQNTLLRQQALTEAHQGHYDAAIALFTCLIERNPSNANDYSNRGLVHFQSGEGDAALADYNRAIELNPRLDNAYNNRANYYAAQGQFLEAILDYDVALDLNPTNVRAWINQGITFRELELYDRAIESFELALCLRKLEGHIYAERGRTNQLRGDWNCAVGDYYRALENLPEAEDTHHSPSARLRLQVQSWLDQLLNPLQPQA